MNIRAANRPAGQAVSSETLPRPPELGAAAVTDVPGFAQALQAKAQHDGEGPQGPVAGAGTVDVTRAAARLPHPLTLAASQGAAPAASQAGLPTATPAPPQPPAVDLEDTARANPAPTPAPSGQTQAAAGSDPAAVAGAELPETEPAAVEPQKARDKQAVPEPNEAATRSTRGGDNNAVEAGTIAPLTPQREERKPPAQVTAPMFVNDSLPAPSPLKSRNDHDPQVAVTAAATGAIEVASTSPAPAHSLQVDGTSTAVVGPPPVAINLANPEVTASASTSPPEPSAPVANTELKDWLAQPIVHLIASSRREMAIQLRPPELGVLTVRVAVNGREVSTWFETPQTQVQQAITQAIPQLHTDLGNAGYTLTGAWVGADANTGDAPQPMPLPALPRSEMRSRGLASESAAMRRSGTGAASGVNIYV